MSKCKAGPEYDISTGVNSGEKKGLCFEYGEGPVEKSPAVSC